MPSLDRDLQSTQLDGRVALVTGAGQGIGRAFAHAFAAAGAVPIVADINASQAERVAGEIASQGAKVLAAQVDVSEEESVGTMTQRVLDEFGRIDVLVNNAAIFSTLKMRPFLEIPIDEWDRVMRVNVNGPFLCSKAVAGTMKKNGFGRIINISSASIRMGRPNYLHYTTSKSALIGMTRSMARELGAFGITVNAVLPGATFTEVPRETVTAAQKDQIISAQCIPRPQTPDDLVGIVLFLASDGSAFVTGQSIVVDGGCTHS